MMVTRCQYLINANELSRCESLLQKGSELIGVPEVAVPLIEREELISILGELLQWIALKVSIKSYLP
jgi:hypothetical protein